MSVLIVCDKCGKSDNDITKFMHIKAYEIINTALHKNSSEKEIEMCKDCYEKIFKEDYK